MAAMQEVIDLGDSRYGFAHSGGITINISHTPNGLLVRYREAFGVRLQESPDQCSFQKGEHMFFAPVCRTDTRAIATEWFIRAAGAPGLEPGWIAVGTGDFFVTHAAEGRQTTLMADRFQRALFYERPEDLAAGRASKNLMTTATLYAINRYGTTRDWLDFYERFRSSEDGAAIFEDEFGETLEAFYSAFESWADDERIRLLTTAFDSCEEAAEHLKPRGGIPGVDAGFPDYRVPSEIDQDEDGIVCEGVFPR